MIRVTQFEEALFLLVGNALIEKLALRLKSWGRRDFIVEFQLF